MQKKITEPSKLLNKRGELIQTGYATSPILEYRRKDVARKHRLKEWDYYLVYNECYAVALTVAKSGSLLLASATIIDFKDKKETTKTILRFVPGNRLNMPESSVTGDILYHDKKLTISFKHDGTRRRLYLKIKNFLEENDFEATLTLFHEPKDSMVIATPFQEDRKAFYYNQKIIGMSASGNVHFNDKTITFSPMNTYGLLDWGRGVWPHKVTWYWGAGMGQVWENHFGFNLGYGFGDTSAATENMLFFDGIASKLEDIAIQIPQDEKNKFEYLKPWKIVSSDQRFEMDFVPMIDRNVKLSALFLSTEQHQVFGKYTGYTILDDGTLIYLFDFLGFAERVVNKW